MDLTQVIAGRERDLGGFSVRRVLPSAARQMVGPFIFFDHLGPAGFAPGTGIDVRPHPHIALATVTYLFAGALRHRDSLGSDQEIRPGDVNWMTAGRGIVHSERTPPAQRSAGAAIHGIQSWVALPDGAEDVEPQFTHHPAASLPRRVVDGADLTVVAGTAFGLRSPVATLWPTLGAKDPLARFGGWRELAGSVDAEARAEGAAFVLARDYAAVSLLTYYGDGATPVLQSAEAARWRFRPPPAPNLFDAPGIAVAYVGADYPDLLRSRFRTVEWLERLPRKLGGVEVAAGDLYRVADPIAPPIAPR